MINPEFEDAEITRVIADRPGTRMWWSYRTPFRHSAGQSARYVRIRSISIIEHAARDSEDSEAMRLLYRAPSRRSSNVTLQAYANRWIERGLDETNEDPRRIADDCDRYESRADHAVWELIDRAVALARLALEWDGSTEDPTGWTARIVRTESIAIVVDPQLIRPSDPSAILADPARGRREPAWAPRPGIDGFQLDMLDA